MISTKMIKESGRIERSNRMKEIKIIYSEEDKCYIARCNDYPSLSAHGDTAEEAREQLHIVIEEAERWIEEEQ